MLEGLEPPVNATYTCKVKTILDDLAIDDRSILEAALADLDKWGHKPLSKALRSRGIEVSDTTLAKHRTGDCRCT